MKEKIGDGERERERERESKKKGGYLHSNKATGG